LPVVIVLKNVLTLKDADARSSIEPIGSVNGAFREGSRKLLESGA